MIENNILSIENENLQIKEKLHCKRCNNKINRKIQNFEICNSCVNELKKIDIEQKKNIKLKIKETKLNNRNILLLDYSEDIKVYNRSGENKICNTCKENKYFKEYYIIKDNKSKDKKMYLNPKCKNCCSARQVKKSKKVDKILNNFLESVNTN